MNLLMVGDVVGRAGRHALRHWLPILRREFSLDLIVVNGENAAGGIGISNSVMREIFAAGADVITSGNHIWKFKEIFPSLQENPRLLRPHNYPEGAPGSGLIVVGVAGGLRIAVLNLLGRVFMGMVDCPFRVADHALSTLPLKQEVDAILVDFHAEATSEKMAMAHYLDGRVSAVLGTHTHVPTSDHRILAKGTAAMTDIGMTGPYDSIIGMQTAGVLQGILSGLPTRFEPAEGDVTLCGAILQVDRNNGLCRSITPLRRGGLLSATP
ncbi:MAG: TIGR00282 family metallophosphoesterase [Magnetococcales bacterium]|nr:TIGR00282 family metallophosphoesterase [Magnetococcales bacterium]NGZ27795.1 TIGR00282 family metallophosphoesterase [Magnetococcales bacterium]